MSKSNLQVDLVAFGRFIDKVNRHALGWLSLGQAAVLANYAAACPPDDAIVEIGSYQGLSTLCLAYGSYHGLGAPVYAIDPHYTTRVSCVGPQYRNQDTRAYYQNLGQYQESEVIKTLHLSSAQASGVLDRWVFTLFIDGDHRYEAVMADSAAWLPKTRFGGIVMFHDTNETGVQRAVLHYKKRLSPIAVLGDLAVFGHEGTPGSLTLSREDLKQLQAFEARDELTTGVKPKHRRPGLGAFSSSQGDVTSPVETQPEQPRQS